MREELGPGLCKDVCLLSVIMRMWHKEEVTEDSWDGRGGAVPEKGDGLGKLLQVQLVPHGDLPARVFEHLLPVAALRARGVQAQAAVAQHAALPLLLLAQHLQLHAGGLQQVIGQLEHDHLVPHRVDLVLGSFCLLLF